MAKPKKGRARKKKGFTKQFNDFRRIHKIRLPCGDWITLSANTKNLYYYLVNLNEQYGADNTNPSYYEISIELCMNKRTAIRCVEDLTKAGLIEVTKEYNNNYKALPYKEVIEEFETMEGSSSFNGTKHESTDEKGEINPDCGSEDDEWEDEVPF